MWNQNSLYKLLQNIQSDSGGKVNILGGDSIGRCEKNVHYQQVSNSELLPRQSCLNLQIQNHYKR
jgi:hypothetical protein